MSGLQLQHQFIHSKCNTSEKIGPPTLQQSHVRELRSQKRIVIT